MENIGPRSVITRQSHTWFHVRRPQNFKEESLQDTSVSITG